MDTEKLISRREELIRIVEAIDELLRSKAWQTLRTSVFDPLEERLDRQILSEAKKTQVDTNRIYVLQGELSNAKKYDLAHYAEKCKKELEGIKLKLG